MKLFWKVIMHYHVTGCVIFISNKTEYLKKLESKRNSIKEVMLWS